MSQLVTLAAKGQKKAMTALYESNKKPVYALCRLLLDDTKKASLMTEDVINGSWNKITVREISEDKDFSGLLKTEAAKLCAVSLFGRSLSAFKVSKASSEGLKEDNAEYTGDLQSGYKQLCDALDALDPGLRFVYLLKAAGELDFSEISQAIVQREAAARYFYECACKELSKKLDSDTLSFAEIPSLLRKYSESTVVPFAVDTSCLSHIKDRAKIELPPARVAVPVISGVLFFVLVLSFLIYWRNENVLDYTSGSSTISATAGDGTSDSSDALSEYDGYVPTLLDENLTYYADIKIKDYGTVTVKLEQDDAPMSAANFVELANSGFYDGLTFHRIIEGFMMQGGDPNGDGYGGSENTIFGEFESNGFANELKHTRGAVSMARSSENNSASSQFFIVHEESDHLDGDYAVFGYVTEGMDVVDAVCKAAEPTDGNGTIPSAQQPVIESVTIRNE